MNRKWMLLAAALMSTSVAVAAPFSKQVTIGSQNRVLISNIAGSVKITSWDRREVDVQGELGDGIDHVDVNQDSGIVDIKVVLKDNGWSEGSFRNHEAKLQIKLPADAQIEANTISASISVNGVRGKQRLKSVSGDIRSDVASTDLDLKTVSGRIDALGTGTAARVRATSVSGTVTLNHLGGEVEASSTSGDVDVELQNASSVRASVVSGDVSLTGALARDGELEAASVSGRVKIATQIPSGFNYDVTTFSGVIRNCFGVQVDRQRGFGGSRMSGSRGEGKATVRARSHSGTVDLCDR